MTKRQFQVGDRVIWPVDKDFICHSAYAVPQLGEVLAGSEPDTLYFKWTNLYTGEYVSRCIMTREALDATNWGFDWMLDVTDDEQLILAVLALEQY